MKKLLLLLLLALPIMAQSATRNVSVSWTVSTSSGVTGYNVSRAVTATGPFTSLTATPLPATAVSFNDPTAVVGQTYTYQVFASAAACTPTTPVATPCGNSTPVTASTTVPPQPGATITVTLTVP